MDLESLKNNSYPCRGIIMGLDETGTQAIQVYWLMGRSKNSRNRIIIKKGDNIRTQAFDSSKTEDPSLIIYNVMMNVESQHIVSNGDQTDTIAMFLREGRTFTEALETKDYEPDNPNFTPRISGMITVKQNPSFLLSIIRQGSDGKTIRKVFDKTKEVQPGFGFCIHTYLNDGNPLPSFDKEPYKVSLIGNIEQIARTYWDLLNKENRVSLVVKGIDLETGNVDYASENKYGSAWSSKDKIRKK